MKCENYNHKNCLSCDLLNLKVSEVIELKEKKLKSLFSELDDKVFLSSVFVENAEKTRYKAKFAVSICKDKTEFGIYDTQMNFKKLEDCPLHADGINELIVPLKQLQEKYRIIPYDVKKRIGELKFVIISKSFGGNSFLVRFILRSKESLDRLKKLTDELIENFPEVEVITANIQPEPKAVLEGKEEEVLSHQKMITHHFNKFKFHLGARSFFQVTPWIAEKLYESFSLMLNEDQPQYLLDLYCGVGAFSHYGYHNAANVVGVEISKEAIEFARLNIERNNLDKKKISYEALDVEDYLKTNVNQFDAIIVNPPRRGLNTTIVNSIKTMRPNFLYYSSCNSETLFRDYQELKEVFELVSLQNFEMFPNTTHFETLARFKLKK